MIEAILGPVLALLVSMKFTQWKTKPPKYTHEEMIGRIELLEKSIQEKISEKSFDEKLSKQLFTALAPVAIAMRDVKEHIGV